METGVFFERNISVLWEHNPGLSSRLSSAEASLSKYAFLESRAGITIPAIKDGAGSARPLHSTFDPVREAERLVSGLTEKAGQEAPGFFVFLGLGGGFLPAAALKSGAVSQVLVIDFDINGIAGLFRSLEYASLLGDPRFTLLVDPSPESVEGAILELYNPALCGGIRVQPLLPRTDLDKKSFAAAAAAVQRAVDKISSDYSVQAYFGTRWFSNIIRNLGAAAVQRNGPPQVYEAAICAAGPSLDMQIPLLQERKELSGHKLFIISADTAFPALLGRGLKPDAVVSIDCQHISYYHFVGTDCRDIPLFLDIASPPLLAGFSRRPFFYSGGHPLAAYVSGKWLPLPPLDTSGGNVTHSCLSLAESLGARKITVYGADFSYPAGRTYAKGTYIYPYFERRQERRRPLEAGMSSFLYRAPFLPPETGRAPGGCGSPVCYETAALRFYRKCFEQKIAAMEAEVASAPGLGVPLRTGKKPAARPSGFSPPSRAPVPATPAAPSSAAAFLEQYRRDIMALPSRGGRGAAGICLRELDPAGRNVFLTLLPQMAAIRRRRPELAAGELVDAVKDYSAGEIERVLNSGLPGPP